MSLSQQLFNIAFSFLFGLHVILRAFNLDAWECISKTMFWIGEKASTGRGRRLPIDEVAIEEANVEKKTPFVVRGFFREVTPGEFLKMLSHEPVQTHSYDNGVLEDETMSFADLVRRIQQGKSTNAKTVTFCKEKLAFLRDVEARVDILRGTTDMKRGRLSQQFFVGGPDTFTRCHADPSLNCYVQLAGVKRWLLSPPCSASELYVLPRGPNQSYNSKVLHDYSRFPAYERADKYVVDIHPGDLLVIPPFWFHEVSNLAPTEPTKMVVVGMAMNWLSPRHAWRQACIMAAGSLFRPRILGRYIFPNAYSIDDDVMRSCRQLTCCDRSFVARDEKTEKYLEQ